jgi:hypothetical protein
MKLTALAVLLAFAASAQEKPEKIAIFLTGLDEAVSVVHSLTDMMNASKPFEAVGQKDPSKVAILVSCMNRKAPEVPLVCMYVSQYNGAAFKTFLGGGLFVAQSANEIATTFLGSIAQDILERYNDTDKTNLKEALEACLFLTDSKCNVPSPFQKDLDAKQLTLGQYLMIQHQKGEK